MGHAVNADHRYRLLQRQLDRTVTGAPDSPALMKILRLLFSADDAELASRLPNRLTPLGALSRRLGLGEDRLAERLGEMARRGLVVDLEHDGRRYFALAPVVIGFFEFTFMRRGEDLPLAELARLFDEYWHEGRFARSVFGGPTQIGRSLVHEEAIAQRDHTEILDWERASRIVGSASAIGVSVCACRHKASHLGQACQRPQRNCLSFSYAAESLIRNGLAERITAGEALEIIEESKKHGLAQTGDNVQRKVAFICNCCGCCCGLIQGIRHFGIRGAIVTSNWIMEVDSARCKSCGECAAACPVDAIELRPTDGPEKRRVAVCDQTLCLGCGVCHSICRAGAIAMKRRPKRVLAPETIFDRMTAMALERGKLAGMVFDHPERLSHRALARIVGLLERSPLAKAAMAIRPLRSAFLRRLVAEARKKTGKIGEILE